MGTPSQPSKRPTSFIRTSAGTAITAWLSRSLHTHEIDQALECAAQALALTADDTSRAITHNLNGNIFLVIGKNEPKKLKNAEEEYRQATHLDASRAEYHLNLARAFLLQSKDEDAKPELQAC
jgi:hypothetical protein